MPATPLTCRSVRAALATALTAWLCACGATRPLDNFSEDFDTHIYDDGTKVFMYHFRTEKELYALSPLNYSEGFSDGQRYYTPEELRKQSARQLESRLSNLMEEKRFCRDGYLTLSSYAGYGTASLRGECREAATAEDREKFPNEAAGNHTSQR